MTGPTIGSIVYYTLTTEDTFTINARRFQSAAVRTGTPTTAGDTFPAIIVATSGLAPGAANLQVFLDGNDTHWTVGTLQGTTPGTWHHTLRTP